MWSFDKEPKFSQIDTDKLLREVTKAVNETLNTQVLALVERFYSELVLGAQYARVGGTYKESTLNAINNSFTKYVKELLDKYEQDIITSKVETYIHSEEFIDKIIDRINSKQVRA